ncbi:inorganic pyrophosphatase Ppa [Desulfonema ishimotonii]|uniref:Inorganic pyrophosphatase Ppa n=1 Tax=Desulfonema ishimotonii TaxID=45657 RepID=A0A401G177_9BACT|nr:inorganic pyrophosphatase Ppa [Desulfonema ishimotonii]GBC62965.1 inorganic pyrophosphatase Ppa [Desulfonema ishimotonii]
MPMTKFLQEAKKFEIQAYNKKKDFKRLKDENVPFSGSPLKHPYDPNKVILVADPYSTNTYYYEFRTEDIAFVEELPSLVNIDGESVNMARVWIKKKRVGVRCTPFVVEAIGMFSNNRR